MSNVIRYWHICIHGILLYAYHIPASVTQQPTTPLEEQQLISISPAPHAQHPIATTKTPTPAAQPKNKPLTPQKPAEPTDEKITIFNATPVTISIRYERIGNPGIIEPIKPNSMITIMRNPATPMLYSLESGGQTAPITPDMIIHGQITIKVPPELMQSLSGQSSTGGTATAPSQGSTQTIPSGSGAPPSASAPSIIPQAPPAKK